MENLERLNVIDTLTGEYKARILELQEQRREVMSELDASATTYKIMAENEAAENETFEKELTMEKTNEVPIPKIGEVVHENLTDAIAERKRLQNHPQPRYGWTPGIANLIDQRVTCLTTMIADLVVKERKT